MQYLCKKNRGVNGKFNEFREFKTIGLRPSLNSLSSLNSLCLLLYNAATDQYIATIPCGKLARGDAALRLVEEYIHAFAVAD